LRQKDEFQKILDERNVVENLNKLEDLITDAKRRKARASDSAAPPTPPHTLPAPQILAAHQTPILASQQSQLNAKIQTTQSQNATLAKTLVEQRKEMGELLGVLDMVVRDLEKAGGVLGEQGEELAGEARGAEVEMREVGV
jgi:kinetochore protein NNF1